MIRSLKQNSLSFLFVTVLFIMAGATTACSNDDINSSQLWLQPTEGVMLSFQVEIARTGREQEIGLMNRSFLAGDAGMLFDFGQPARMRAFWMKDTLIPLDIIFIEKDGTIHHIHHMAKPLDETRITSKRPSVAVLEINGGYAQSLGIEVGDKVLHPIFRNMLAQ